MRLAFDRRFLDELAARSDIVDVVGSYVSFKQQGSKYWACCPFHSEKTPSFLVTPDNQMYYCFGCKKGGGVIGFIMEIENLSYPDAVRFLARRANLTVPEDTRDDGSSRLRSRLLALNRDAARYFYARLQAPEGEPVRQYLRERRISRKNATNFGLGAADESWDSLLRAMRDKGYSESELAAAGLIVRGRNGGYYDKFRGRLIFPIVDVRGDVLGFGGRIIRKDDTAAKYMNTPETVVYSKRRVLYGLNLARKSKRGNILLVEGNIDVVMLHQAGFDNACASMGTALTREQLQLLTRYTKELVLCYDNDDAGKAATQKALSLLNDTGFNVRVLELPRRLADGQYVKQDADDFIKYQGADAFENLLSGSESGMDFRMAQLRAQHPPDGDRGRVEYAQAAAELLASVSGSVEREVYTVRAAEEAGISADAFRQEVRRAAARRAKKERREQEKRDLRPAAAMQPRERSLRYENTRSASAEEGVLRLLVLDDTLFGAEPPLTEEEFSSPLLARLFAALWRQREEPGGIRIGALDGEFGAEELGHLTGVLQKPESPDHAARERALRDYLRIIRDEHAKRGGGEDPLLAAVKRYQKR